MAASCQTKDKKPGRVMTFLKNWTLPLAMLIGALAYFVAAALPLEAEVRHDAYVAVSHYVQPVLLFCMLFLSFTKVSPKEMRPRWWHLWLLLAQGGLFTVCSLIATQMPDEGSRVLMEGAMLSLICPTATASAVITGKLGGSVSGVVTYLLLCNLMVSLLAPALLPLVEPKGEASFVVAFLMILSKVLPLLICPLLLAWVVRFFVHPFYRWLLRWPDLSFYIWSVALAMAITVTVRSIVHSDVGAWYMVGLALISCVCCLLQFWLGRRIGGVYGDTERITAGQAFGQKNTVFVIWMGQVFLNPVTSVVGGFYSVWHNIVNSYQLYEARKHEKRGNCQ